MPTAEEATRQAGDQKEGATRQKRAVGGSDSGGGNEAGRRLKGEGGEADRQLKGGGEEAGK